MGLCFTRIDRFAGERSSVIAIPHQQKGWHWCYLVIRISNHFAFGSVCLSSGTHRFFWFVLFFSRFFFFWLLQMQWFDISAHQTMMTKSMLMLFLFWAYSNRLNIYGGVQHKCFPRNCLRLVTVDVYHPTKIVHFYFHLVFICSFNSYSVLFQSFCSLLYLFSTVCSNWRAKADFYFSFW